MAQDVPFSLVFLPLCGCSEWLGQCKGWPDDIPDYYWAEPGQAYPGKTTAEWRPHFSGVLSSGGPGQCCYDHLSMLRQASFPGSVHVQWLWWPTQSWENRQQVARAGTCWPNKHQGLTLRKAWRSAWELSVDGYPFLQLYSFKKKKLEVPFCKSGLIISTRELHSQQLVLQKEDSTGSYSSFCACGCQLWTSSFWRKPWNTDKTQRHKNWGCLLYFFCFMYI